MKARVKVYVLSARWPRQLQLAKPKQSGKVTARAVNRWKRVKVQCVAAKVKKAKAKR